MKIAKFICLPALVLILFLAACTSPSTSLPLSATGQPILTATSTPTPTLSRTPAAAVQAIMPYPAPQSDGNSPSTAVLLPYPPPRIATKTPNPSGIGRFPSLFILKGSDLNHAWAVAQQDGDRHLVRTEDGGQTWRDVMPAHHIHNYSSDEIFSVLDANTTFTVLTTGENSETRRTLFRTTDGGQTWQSWQFPFQYARLYFFNANSGWAMVGHKNNAASELPYDFYRTANGGQTWSQVEVTRPDDWSALKRNPMISFTPGYDMSFQDVHTLWTRAVPSPTELVVSRDAGKTWQPVHLPAAEMFQIASGGGLFNLRPALGGGPAPYSLPYFINEKEGFLYAYLSDNHVAIYQTSDGGQTWSQSWIQQISGVTLSSNNLPDIQFVTARDWFIPCRPDLLCATHDGGQTWLTLPFNMAVESSPMGTTFIDAANGWTSVRLPEMDNYILYHTTDGGKTWQPIVPRPVVGLAPTRTPFPTAPVANSPDFTRIPQPSTGVTTPGAPLSSWAHEFHFVDAGTIFGEVWTKLDQYNIKYQLLRTTDGGRTWRDVTPADHPKGFSDNISPHLTGILNANIFFVAAPFNSKGNTTIYRTRDGGQTWDIGEPGDMNSITMFDAKNGWARSPGGCENMVCSIRDYRLYFTTNGGLTWSLYHPQPPLQVAPNTRLEGWISVSPERGFLFQSPNIIWEGGGSRDYRNELLKLLVSRDAGMTWKEVHFDLPESLIPAYMHLPTFLNDHEGFLSVNAQLSPTPAPGGKPHFVQAIFATTDGGRTWTPRPMLDFGDWESSIQFATSTDWYTNCNGALCATHDGGQTWQSLPYPLIYGSPSFSIGRFFDARNGFATAHDASLNDRDHQELYGTHDGGRTWTKVSVELK